MPVTPERREGAQKAAYAARALLEEGNEEQARAEIRRSLGLDPQNELALSFQKQLDVDPVAFLGSEWVRHTLRQNETLSLLAKQHLGDQHLFYILARYNDIRVPRQVAVGQVIRLPAGYRRVDAEAARLPSPPPPREAPSPRPDRDRAEDPKKKKPAPQQTSTDRRDDERPRKPLPAQTAPETSLPRTPVPAPAPPTATAPGPAPVVAPAPAPPAAPVPSADDRARQVKVLLAAARAAEARQDLDGAIAAWNRVLALEPTHPAAQRERDRVRELKRKFDEAR